MSRQIQAALLALTFVLGVACDGSPVAPTTRPPTPPSAPSLPAPPPAPPSGFLASLLGQWTGLSTVQSVDGVLPSCMPSFWKTGFADTISAELVPLQGTADAIDLHIRLNASNEFCHLKFTGSESGVAARSFDEDDFGFEGEAWCHFRLQTTTWGCADVEPEVWIRGIKLTGTFPNDSRTQMHGTLEIPYAHRPGDSPRNGRSGDMTVIKRFELTKISP